MARNLTDDTTPLEGARSLIALRLGADGTEQGVPVREIAVGDLVVVKPGERYDLKARKKLAGAPR